MTAPEFSELFSLEGRTALVTGGSKGIGQAIAVGLSQAGADIVLLGRTDNLDDTSSRISRHGVDVRHVTIDLSEPHRIADRWTAQGGEELVIDILVNNAGRIERSAFQDTSLESWRRVMNVNTDAVFVLSHLVGRQMIARGAGGKLINIASMLAFQGGVNVVSYATSKHAVLGMTRALANELADYGIQVNAIAPGYIETDNTAPLRAEPARRRSIEARIPLGRWGLPTDLVGTAIFLSSRASDYMTGQVISVDGGWLSS